MQPIKAKKDRVVVSVDMNYKDSHTFQDGTKIALVRRVNNFNRRHTEPVNAIVVDSEYIPKGSEILIHHNATHDTNRLFNYGNLSGEDIASDIRYFSVHEEMCYLWRESKNDEWKPLKNFATAYRVFEPYDGILQGVEPKKIKNVLYIRSGEFKGQVVRTLHACDYCVIFQNEFGREEQIIRCRHFGDYYNEEREEIVAVDHDLTDMVLKGELLIGISTSDCKKHETARNMERCS